MNNDNNNKYYFMQEVSAKIVGAFEGIKILREHFDQRSKETFGMIN